MNGNLEEFLKTGYEEGIIPNLHLRIVGGYREVEYYPSTKKFYSRQQGGKDIFGIIRYPEMTGYGILGAIEVALYDNFYREDKDEKELECEWGVICATG